MNNRRYGKVEKEKEGNVWRRKRHFWGGEGIGGKYLEKKKNFWRKRRTEKEKEANIIEKERLVPTGGRDGMGGQVEGF